MKKLKAIWQILTAKRFFIATIENGNWYVQNTFDEKDLSKSNNAIYFH